jgi:hypothetical protein
MKLNYEKVIEGMVSVDCLNRAKRAEHTIETMDNSWVPLTLLAKDAGLSMRRMVFYLGKAIRDGRVERNRRTNGFGNYFTRFRRKKE